MKMGEYIEKAKHSDLWRSIAFVGGDFNYIPAGEKAALVVDGSTFPTVDDVSSHIKPLAPVLRQCVELFQLDVTRMGTASNAKGNHYFIAYRINCIYASWLPLQCYRLN